MDGSVTLNRRLSMDGKPPDQTSDECIICCERITDKAFVGDCLHYFCFRCLKQWTSVRAVCPLCVQPITSIINNVRSADDYDVQAVQPPEHDVLSNGDLDTAFWDTMSDDDDDDDYDEDVDDYFGIGTRSLHSDISDDELDEYLQITIDHIEDGDADAEISDDEDGQDDASLDSGSDGAVSFQYATSDIEEDDEDVSLHYCDSDMVECGTCGDNVSESGSVWEEDGSASEGNDSTSDENDSSSEEGNDVSDSNSEELSCAYDNQGHYSDYDYDNVSGADYNSEEYNDGALSDCYYYSHDEAFDTY